jgi:hypothetical protein
METTRRSCASLGALVGEDRPARNGSESAARRFNLSHCSGSSLRAWGTLGPAGKFAALVRRILAPHIMACTAHRVPPQLDCLGTSLAFRCSGRDSYRAARANAAAFVDEVFALHATPRFGSRDLAALSVPESARLRHAVALVCGRAREWQAIHGSHLTPASGTACRGGIPFLGHCIAELLRRSRVDAMISFIRRLFEVAAEIFWRVLDRSGLVSQ